jgi:hypothetical protein
MNPCKSTCDGALLRCAMLASSSTFKVCLGRCASRALHYIRLADFSKVSSALLAVLMVLFLNVPAHAAETAAPKLDIGKGGQCVEDTQWMRKNHMHLLKHGRDDALRRGIRDEKHSLKACIECHASTQDDSVIAREDSFCVGCHKYEAVKLDCFECHSGTRKSAWLAQRDKK